MLPQFILSVTTLEGNEIRVVACTKSLALDDSLTFKLHVEKLVKKLRIKPGFYFKISCFSFIVKKQLAAARFLPVLDYGDLLCMNASAQCLHMLVQTGGHT